jgi:phosphate/sulfate permease
LEKTHTFSIISIDYLGAKVSDTIRKGIIDPSLFDDPKELMLGQVSSLLSKLMNFLDE